MSVPGILRRLSLLCLLVATGATAILVVVTSLDPDNYFYYRHDKVRDWSHPTTGVVATCAAVIIEAAVAAAALRSDASGRFWRRGLLALLPLVLWSVAVTGFVVHMPTYVLIHHAWLWLLLLALGVGVAFSGLGVLLSKLRPLRSSATP